MASYSVTTSKHATLAASTVDTITFGSRWGTIEVYNRDASALIYFTADGTTPTVAGDNTYVVGPGSALRVSSASASPTVVKAISSATPAYSVTGS